MCCRHIMEFVAKLHRYLQIGKFTNYFYRKIKYFYNMSSFHITFQVLTIDIFNVGINLYSYIGFQAWISQMVMLLTKKLNLRE